MFSIHFLKKNVLIVEFAYIQGAYIPGPSRRNAHLTAGTIDSCACMPALLVSELLILKFRCTEADY